MIARTRSVLLYCLLPAVILAGCAVEQYTREDFRFPILNGDIDQGRNSFVALGCHQCHSVNGVDLPVYPGESPLQLELGGEIIYVKTYGELVTSIINPNHVISEKYLDSLDSGARQLLTSPMPFKREMTIEQLVDVVTFLNSRYVLLQPHYTVNHPYQEPEYR